MAQLAIAWVGQNDNAASAITGGSRPEQITGNVQAGGKVVAADTLIAIDAALEERGRAGPGTSRGGQDAERGGWPEPVDLARRVRSQHQEEMGTVQDE